MSNFGVVTEQSYLLVENHKNDGPGQKKRETDLGAKPKNFFRPIVELGTITETTHGLKTLAKTNDNAEDKHADADHNAHGSDGSIAIVAGNAVEGLLLMLANLCREFEGVLSAMISFTNRPSKEILR